MIEKDYDGNVGYDQVVGQPNLHAKFDDYSLESFWQLFLGCVKVEHVLGGLDEIGMKFRERFGLAIGPGESLDPPDIDIGKLFDNGSKRKCGFLRGHKEIYDDKAY